ncbi:hypothetical protein OK016_09080 [Vibrio chagasii]|nr:hypothetical protein [Vibrio chagasii]
MLNQDWAGNQKTVSVKCRFALKAYASMATSADKGAVRDKSKLEANL